MERGRTFSAAPVIVDRPPAACQLVLPIKRVEISGGEKAASAVGKKEGEESERGEEQVTGSLPGPG